MRSSPFLVVLDCTQSLVGFRSNVAKSFKRQAMGVIKANTGIKTILEMLEVMLKKR